MNRQYIVERFALISNLTMNEASKWADVCAEAGNQIMNQVKPNIDLSKAETTLNALAATLALYRYALYANSIGNAQSYTVGDISVSADTDSLIDVDKAREVYEEARISASDYLMDQDFDFIQVRT